MADLCRQVVDDNHTLRQTTHNTDGRPIFFQDSPVDTDGNLPALSHTTPHRWLTFLAAMTISLQMGIEAFLQIEPESTVYRFVGNVDPRRARSEIRLQALSTARRLLYLQTLWDQHILTAPFFARFATVSQPP